MCPHCSCLYALVSLSNLGGEPFNICAVCKRCLLTSHEHLPRSPCVIPSPLHLGGSMSLSCNGLLESVLCQIMLIVANPFTINEHPGKCDSSDRCTANGNKCAFRELWFTSNHNERHVIAAVTILGCVTITLVNPDGVSRYHYFHGLPPSSSSTNAIPLFSGWVSLATKSVKS